MSGPHSQDIRNLYFQESFKSHVADTHLYIYALYDDSHEHTWQIFLRDSSQVQGCVLGYHQCTRWYQPHQWCWILQLSLYQLNQWKCTENPHLADRLSWSAFEQSLKIIYYKTSKAWHEFIDVKICKRFDEIIMSLIRATWKRFLPQLVIIIHTRSVIQLTFIGVFHRLW